MRRLLGEVLAAACMLMVLRGALAQPSTRLVERSLRHLRLDLNEVRQWEDDRPSSRRLSTKKPWLVVHLFSLDCPPCLEELPQLKPLFQRNMPDIEFALVLETLDLQRIRDFLQKEAGRLPDVDLYLSTDRRLRSTAQIGIDTVPLTLVLDQQLVVRQAFVGSLKDRMSQLKAALVGLQASLKKLSRDFGHNLTEHQQVDGDVFLHRQLDLLKLPDAPPGGGKPARRKGRHAEPDVDPRLSVLYLAGASCSDCVDGMDKRLTRMAVAWRGEREVRFLSLRCTEENRLFESDPAATSLDVRECREAGLLDLWNHLSRPVTLLVDEQQVVRDVFAGPVGSNVGIALRRLHSSLRLSPHAER